MSGFQPAVKTAIKARVAIYGVGGSGKTTHALTLARVLAGPDGTIALLDGEGGSAARYADAFQFDMQEQHPPFHPQRVADALEAAQAGGYSVFIADGISPYWSGSGGVLQIVDEAKKRGGGWADGTPAHLKMIYALLDARIHVIFTVRAKGDTVVDKDERGRTEIRKIGLKPDTREGLEYEVDCLLYADVADNSITIEKTRIAKQLGVKIPAERSQEWAEGFKAWLNSGPPPLERASVPAEGPPPAAAPTPAAPPPAAPPSTPPPADPTGGLGPAAPETPAEGATGPTGAEGATAPVAEQPATISEMRSAIRERIKLAVAAITPHDAEIGSKVSAKIPTWFAGKTKEGDLDDAQADELATKLEATLQMYQQSSSA